MFIRTERLFLRPAWPEDSVELHAALAHEAVVRNLAVVPWPYTLADARAFVALPQDRGHPRFLITLPGARGSRVIGGIALVEYEQGAELGYWITPDAWGRGYATEAASAVVRLARTLNHRQVCGRPFLDNIGSARVLEKVGLRAEGPVTDHFSVGRGEVVPARSFVIRFDGASDCDGAPDPGPAFEPDMRAA
jgi:RimJ/RimL family protein N-acetyltransferase